ncbi:uncharacterized protein JCM6883_000979 [Sporobolomyces salmoneus]|uniref:uncharacterized protein n=1 Tax=Sporobolomyces salmoneus TaxID=183962 RepID=UPI003181E440
MSTSSSRIPFDRDLTFPLRPSDLQRWLRFSAKGGIGRARAKVDRVSEDGDRDLMMLQGDEIVVLMELSNGTYLGHCEGVVGLFRGEDVDFLQARLKKPVMTPRSSTVGKDSSRSRSKPSFSLGPGSLPSTSAASNIDRQPAAEHGDRSGSIGNGNGQDAQTQLEQLQDLGVGRAAEVEGLGIEVRTPDEIDDAYGAAAEDDSRVFDSRHVSSTRSPDLAGAFSASCNPPSTPSLDDTHSPAYSSDSHAVPSLLTSPHSEDTTHSAPRTPRTPATDSFAMTYAKEKLSTPLFEFMTNESPLPLPLAAFPSSIASDSPTLDSLPASVAFLADPRQPKTSDSTIASQASSLSAPGSAATSIPGTPGDDPTLAFIFDSYRYSVVPNPNSVVGGGLPTSRGISSPRRESAEEKVETTRERQTEAEDDQRPRRTFGAASELRERMRRNGEAASAIPPHISPTRTRLFDSSNSPASSNQIAFPSSSTSDSLASAFRDDIDTEHATPSTTHGLPAACWRTRDSPRAQQPHSPNGRLSESPESLRSATRSRSKSNSVGLRALQISPSSARWRSPNDASPVTRVPWNALDPANELTDVFVDSPASSQSRAQSENTPSSRTFEVDQYARRPLAASNIYAPSPSSISFHSSVSTDDLHSSLDHTTGVLQDDSYARNAPIPNKLRKKPSLRLRKSSSRRQLNDSQDSFAVAGILHSLATLPNRSVSDPFYTSSLPSSPAHLISRKNSIGSKLSRKSAEKEKEKRVDYGAGISNKDFEEETVQIGANAFEIVKPFAALLSQEEHDRVDNDLATQSPRFVESDDLHTQAYLAPSTSLVTGLSTPSPHLQTSFTPTVHSHFSPPTPLSAEGAGRSVEDHRAKELKWIQALSSGISAAEVRKSKKMRTLVQSGIPSSVRGKVWAFLAESDREKQPGLYEQLCSLGPGRYLAAIEQDVETLLIDNPQFAHGSAGREDLFAVLNAFSHFDRQLGHYPGLANIVALLLVQMPAEEAFYALVSLVKNYGFRQFFTVGREELRLELIAFSFLLEMVEPKTARVFRGFQIGTTEYLTSWLSSFFLSILPLPTVLRIVDIFLLDPKTRYRAPLALLRLAQYTDSARFPSRDSVLNYLLAPPPTAFSPAVLIPAISNYKLSDDKVQKAIKKAAQEMLAPRN